jgi:HK97 gp10 family phage protein
MQLRVDLTEVHKLAGDLLGAALVVDAKASLAIAKTALDIEADAKAFCPVDTGFLRGSISSEIEPLEAEIGPTADYAGYVEYGTSRMAPQAYMTPAFDRRAPLLEVALGQLAGDFL